MKRHTILIAIAAMLLGTLGPPGQAAPHKDFPSIKPLLTPRISALEGEVAELMLKRNDAPADQQAVIDLQVDLRLLERWLMDQAGQASPESDEQAQLCLRCAQLAPVAQVLEETVKATKTPLTDNQKHALQALHQLTFKLPDFKDSKDDKKPSLDEVCLHIADAMLNVTSAEGADVKTLPAMRPPKVLRMPLPDVEHPADQATPDVALKPQDLENTVLHAAISGTLRQQLLIEIRKKDAGDSGDTSEHLKVITDAVLLATGMANSGTVPQGTRQALEAQLADGLALYSDARTRSAGKDRIESMSYYLQVMTRVTKLAMTPEQRAAFAPVVAYAQNDPDKGSKAIAAIEQWVSLTATYATLNKPDAAPLHLRKAVEDGRKQFEAARDAFVASAAQIGVAGGPAGPEGLDPLLADMRQTLEICEAINDLPATLDILGAYKPRPFGGLESRLIKAAVAATTPPTPSGKTNGRAEALHYLAAAVRLARSAAVLSHPLSPDVPLAVSAVYAGGALGDFETKCRATVTDAASLVAAGSEPDKAKLDRLETCKEIESNLRQSAAFEAALGHLVPLERWADWRLTSDQIRAAVVPYQQALSAACVGFVNDTPQPIDAFLHLSPHFAPYMKFIIGEQVYTPACAQLPTGFSADLAELATPMDQQPFATERFISYATLVWSGVQADPDAAAGVNSSINHRLAADLHIYGHQEPDGAYHPLVNGEAKP